jgi:hypothetical protein
VLLSRDHNALTVPSLLLRENEIEFRDRLEQIVRESQRLKIAGHPLVWETGYALCNAHGHYLPGYPDEIVELARQQVNDALNHFAVVARADVKSPGGGGDRLAAVELTGFSSITERCSRGWVMRTWSGPTVNLNSTLSSRAAARSEARTRGAAAGRIPALDQLRAVLGNAWA